MRLEQEQPPIKSVLFVDNMEGGELLSRLKEQTRKLSSSLGFRVKVVERCGSSLRSKFPLSNLWEGSQCGRAECITCTQGAEKLPPSTRTSVLYENIWQAYNEDTGTSKELESIKEGSIYIGESSRTIFEWSREHWRDWKSRSRWNENKSEWKRNGQVNG